VEKVSQAVRGLLQGMRGELVEARDLAFSLREQADRIETSMIAISRLIDIILEAEAKRHFQDPTP